MELISEPNGLAFPCKALGMSITNLRIVESYMCLIIMYYHQDKALNGMFSGWIYI